MSTDFQICISVPFTEAPQRCSIKKGVLKNFAKFAGKNLCQGLYFARDLGLRPATLWKKRLRYRCFSVNFVKFSRTPFLHNTPGRLLLLLSKISNNKHLWKNLCRVFIFCQQSNWLGLTWEKKEKLSLKVQVKACTLKGAL